MESLALSEEADDDEECAVASLSLVLLSCRVRGLRLAAASRFCLSIRIRSFCLWLRWPRPRLRVPFGCFSWQRFFLAAMPTPAVASLSERERREDFLGVGSQQEAGARPASPIFLPSSSAEESVSESPRCPDDVGERRQADESLSSCGQSCITEGVDPIVGGGASGMESRLSSLSRQGIDRRPGWSWPEGLCTLTASSLVGELEDETSGFKVES